MNVEELEAQLDDLRTPRRKTLGIWVGPYIQGNPEGGYGGPHLQQIRALRKQIAEYNLSQQEMVNDE